MWTLTDTLIILGSLAIHALLFYALFWNAPKKRWQKLGEKMLANKKKQLNSNPLLRLFARMVDQKKTGAATTIIAFLIYLKCLGMLLIGLVFAGLFIVPVQGALMGVLFEQMKKKGITPQALAKTQNLQLTCMLLLNAAGNWLMYKSWSQGQSLITAVAEHALALAVLGFLALSLAILTARSEVKFFRSHRALIG